MCNDKRLLDGLKKSQNIEVHDFCSVSLHAAGSVDFEIVEPKDRHTDGIEGQRHYPNAHNVHEHTSSNL